MLTVKNLDFSYNNKKIFINLNLRLNSCGFFCLVGPNGAGKSTLLKLIMGYLRPQKGQVCWHKKNLLTQKPQDRAKTVSFVPQQTHQIFDLSTCEFILSGRNPYLPTTIGYNQSDIALCQEVAHRLKIEHLLSQDFSTLSAGETQKAQLARVLLQDTPLLLLDETLAHLDLKHQIEIIKLLKNMSKTKTILLISHNINLALEYSQEIIFLKNGEILRKGEPSQIVDKELLHTVYEHNFTLEKNRYTGKPFLLYH